jgi:hypothetical protein
MINIIFFNYCINLIFLNWLDGSKNKSMIFNQHNNKIDKKYIIVMNNILVFLQEIQEN